MRALETGSKKWQGQYQAGCARLDEAMRALETVIRDRFRQYQATGARLHEQAREPTCYSLIWVQRATAVAKLLVGMSGAGTVLAFAFYIQSYLSILSIKNDCVSLQFVANANLAAVEFAAWFLTTGALALLAIAAPTAEGTRRNRLRRKKGLPPLQPGHEFDGLSEIQVRRIANRQWLAVGFSFFLFFGLTLTVLLSAIGSTPERVRAEWHKFELQCSPQPSDQGVS